ncbi:hypothetical protein [Nocardia macrotermitis]|uniref:Uncharacterized protein n=1 Tax=Nocardia macrotermitis TaxID=2585198 RepID=A0A7K0D613_9NOCA|nr:hypothetical protein [Nocardia macrotermitis]MQY21159.1 hypothetical protein [Nocardia macrotermitis]
MGIRNIQTGRHRLGKPGGVHCLEIPAVATALAAYRRTGVTALINPARHSWAAMRRRTAFAAVRWVPATAMG